MTEHVRVCVLNARKSKKRFCSYLNDNFDCTAPGYEYDSCIGFLKRLKGGAYMAGKLIKFSVPCICGGTLKRHISYAGQIYWYCSKCNRRIEGDEFND